MDVQVSSPTPHIRYTLYGAIHKGVSSGKDWQGSSNSAEQLYAEQFNPCVGSVRNNIPRMRRLFQCHQHGPSLMLVSFVSFTTFNRELAFGPDSEATVRGVALYFNILEEHVTECTPQQAKRFRFKKNPSQESKPKTSEFDGRECFTMIRPHDKDAFEFATDILTHRLETVQAERLSVLHERFEVIKTLQKQKEELRETFLAHKRSWINWCWPISAGRQTIDDDTRVPPVDAEYVPIIDSEAMVEQTETEAIKGSAIQPIWESFVSQSTAFSKIATATGQDNSSIWDADVQPSSSRDRLPILARLGHGEPISLDRSLPQITKGTKHSKTSSLDRQSERCWRALLLRQDNKHHGNEWNIVEEHFQKSRSKKTLRIIQN